jgi:uncharacterized protein YndB with AHSA1/START domain
MSQLPLKDVVVTREFDAPRARIWKAWTDPEDVKRWWGPALFTVPVVRIDLRVGGTFLYCMRGSPAPGAPSRDFYNVGKYLEIVPLEKLVQTMGFGDADGNPVPASHYGIPFDWPEVVMTTTFEDAGEGRTRITVWETNIPEPMSQFARLGWEQSLEKAAVAFKS